MTNAQPEDIIARLDNIDEQLEQLGDEIDLIRTIQNGNRREIRASSQTAARLERTVNRLADIARDHQIALRITSQEAERERAQVALDRASAAQDRQQAAIDRQEFRNQMEQRQREIQQIWEYLRDRNGGSSPLGGN